MLCSGPEVDSNPRIRIVAGCTSAQSVAGASASMFVGAVASVFCQARRRNSGFVAAVIVCAASTSSPRNGKSNASSSDLASRR